MSRAHEGGSGGALCKQQGIARNLFKRGLRWAGTWQKLGPCRPRGVAMGGGVPVCTLQNAL
eukprot:4184385-Pyramimonas_sp.AAC.1